MHTPTSVIATASEAWREAILKKTTRVDKAHESMDCRAVYDGSQ